jgi:hypothetical protein
LHGFYFLINSNIRPIHEMIIYKLNHCTIETVSVTGMHGFTFRSSPHTGYNIRKNMAAVLVFQSEICFFLEARAEK